VLVSWQGHLDTADVLLPRRGVGSAVVMVDGHTVTHRQTGASAMCPGGRSLPSSCSAASGAWTFFFSGGGQPGLDWFGAGACDWWILIFSVLKKKNGANQRAGQSIKVLLKEVIQLAMSVVCRDYSSVLMASRAWRALNPL